MNQSKVKKLRKITGVNVGFSSKKQFRVLKKKYNKLPKSARAGFMADLTKMSENLKKALDRNETKS